MFGYLVYPGAVITTGYSMNPQRSGYYDRVQHAPSDRKQSDERLKLEIKVAHIRTRETYGTRRLQTELEDNGIIVGRDRLARLRKELRLHCKQKRKFRATTNSDHNLPVTPNLLKAGFAPIFPDICYHLTHYKPVAADIPVASDNPAHYADAIRYNARMPLQGSLLPLTRLVWA
ncbi:Transposase [Shigella dysenteriae 1617]|uniref:Transposase n=1 Tax=Shigella dysenteriae 1617 TaxID=754093 RepID=A0A0A6ZSX0_SHIDY|nr:Transposase [Shigella dysenteriae 1617]